MVSKLNILLALAALAPSSLGLPTQAQPRTIQLQARGPGKPFLCTEPPAQVVAERKKELLDVYGATVLGKQDSQPSIHPSLPTRLEG